MIATTKIAVATCVHHKPWLIQSTLISLFAQKDVTFDLFFLLNEGNGELSEHGLSILESYGIRPEEYRNPQLDPYNEKIRDFLPLYLKNTKLIRLKNDDALDSGAWYKFVLSEEWQNYDFVLFFGEGAILTHRHALRDMATFCHTNGQDFVTSGHEKRRIPLKSILSDFAGSSGPLASLHNDMIVKTYEIFSRWGSFKRSVASISAFEKVEQQHHVPEIWGPGKILLRLDSLIHRDHSTRWASLAKVAQSWYSQLEYLQKYLKFLARSSSDYPTSAEHIVVDGKIRKADTVVKAQASGNTLFHEEADPAWFGATCNHFVSRRFLVEFREAIERKKLSESLALPYSATALEFIWGIIPHALGYQKWFSTGIHRVRKQFISYWREDNPEGMVRYLNRYYRGHILCRANHDRLEVVRNRCGPMLDELNSFWD